MNEKARAHLVLNEAVKAGLLMRPEACSHCGSKPSRGRNGCVRIHGHHANGYDKPLEVQWLCERCHTQAHNGGLQPFKRGGPLTWDLMRAIALDLGANPAQLRLWRHRRTIPPAWRLRIIERARAKRQGSFAARDFDRIAESARKPDPTP